MKKVLLFASILILAVSASGCNFPLAQDNDTDSAVKTAVAMDMALTAVASTLTAAAPPVVPTSEIPTLIPATPTVTLTPLPSLTPTPEGVWLTVLENTNCRSGPGTTYEWVTLIAGGVSVEAIARNPVNDYYYVKNPNSTSGHCWLWSKYSSLTGNIANLPVFTPQPTPTVATATPTADFDLSFVRLEYCAPSTAVTIKIRNTGGITWQSLKVVVKDKTTSTEKSHTADVFGWYEGCGGYSSQADLTKGEEGLVSTIPGYFDYDLDNKALKITVTLYSKDGLTGTSVTKSITVTP